MDLLRKADCFQSHLTHAMEVDPAHLSREQARGHCTSSTPGFNSDHGLITLSPLPQYFLHFPQATQPSDGKVG